MRLIDANLLIYAHDEASPQHETCRNWIETTYAEDDLVGIPRISILAFLRITTNPRLMRRPATIEEAMDRMQNLVKHPKTVVLEPGSNHWEVFRKTLIRAQVTGPAVTDAFLASLAMEHGAILCSHDDGFKRYAGLRFENPLST